MQRDSIAGGYARLTREAAERCINRSDRVAMEWEGRLKGFDAIEVFCAGLNSALNLRHDLGVLGPCRTETRVAALLNYHRPSVRIRVVGTCKTAAVYSLDGKRAILRLPSSEHRLLRAESIVDLLGQHFHYPERVLRDELYRAAFQYRDCPELLKAAFREDARSAFFGRFFRIVYLDPRRP